MKIKINSDEQYLVCCISDCGCGYEVEVEDSKVAEWERIFAEFERVQREMWKVMHEEAEREWNSLMSAMVATIRHENERGRA
jgi:hypothetical protein